MRNDEAVIRQQIMTRIAEGDVTGWFEGLYAWAQADVSRVPWVNLRPNPRLVTWLNRERVIGDGQRAIVVGCGVGDDAEELARRGFAVTAFDISETAIALCHQRFPNSTVDYQVADLFALPDAWLGRFALVVELFTVQALPLRVRARAIAGVASLVQVGGEVVYIGRIRPNATDPDGPPWAISPDELALFETHDLTQNSFEKLKSDSDVEYARVVYQRLEIRD